MNKKIVSDKISELETQISLVLEGIKTVKEQLSIPQKSSKRRQSLPKFAAAAMKAIANRNKTTKKK